MRHEVQEIELGYGTEEAYVSLPKSSQVLSATRSFGSAIKVHLLVDPSEEFAQFHFYVYEPGNVMGNHYGEETKFLGSVTMLDQSVVHVFYEQKP